MTQDPASQASECERLAEEVEQKGCGNAWLTYKVACALRLAARQGASAPDDAWKAAVIDALIVACIYRAEHDADPRLAINELIAWEQEMALDPAISKEARDLIERGRRCADREGMAKQAMSGTRVWSRRDWARREEGGRKMTDAELERAARKLCELRSINPDQLIGHGASPDANGNIPAVLLHSPAWKFAAQEIESAQQIAQAIASVKSEKKEGE
ncbi:MAG: hypothetical protein ACYDB1_00670 [Acidiferrobacteraceae bacterium]